MTRCERILAAISHEQPDVVPIDFGASRDSTIVVEGYDRLKKHFGIQAETEVAERMLRIVNVDERILRKFDICTRAVFPGPPLKSLAQNLGPNKYRDMWGVERIQPESSYYYDQLNYPLSGDKNISDLLRYPWPNPDDPGFTKGLRERVQWIRDNTDCAAVLGVPPPFIHTTQYLRGFEDWYCDMAANQSFMEALFDAVLEINMRIAENQLKEVGREVDIVFCGDDLGAQTGLQMKKADYVRYIKPRHEKFFRQIHELSGAKVAFHSCGAISDVIDDLIDIGVDVLNPLQTAARGMEPTALKKKYKGRMAFWGGIDSQKILPRGTVADVKRAVEELIEQMGEGGGYVLAPCHNVQPDVPVENIIAMLEHAREYVPSYLK